MMIHVIELSCLVILACAVVQSQTPVDFLISVEGPSGTSACQTPCLPAVDLAGARNMTIVFPQLITSLHASCVEIVPPGIDCFVLAQAWNLSMSTINAEQLRLMLSFKCWNPNSGTECYGQLPPYDYFSILMDRMLIFQWQAPEMQVPFDIYKGGRLWVEKSGFYLTRHLRCTPNSCRLSK